MGSHKGFKMSIYSALIKVIDFITVSKHFLEFDILISCGTRISVRYFHKSGNYRYKTSNGNILICTKNELLIYLLKVKIISIRKFGFIFFKWVDEYIYHYLECDIIKIQRAWNKYRIKTARLRNDFIIHGLMEYWFHPNHINQLDYLGPSIKYLI